MATVTPFIWFTDGAREAAEYYVSLFNDARIVWVQQFPPGPMAQNVYTLAFELHGTTYYAINGGDDFPPTMAFSFFVEVDSQPEIDRLWDALVSDGGAPSQCGWLTDRWGQAWQIVPRQMWEFYRDGDPEAINRVVSAMFTMSKLDLPTLQAAYDG